MRSGLLRQRVTIEQRVDTQDTFGAEDAPIWSTFATHWASIEPIQGREFFDAQQIQAEVSHRVRLRHVSGVTPKMRVKFGTRIFDIEAVINPAERKRELELLCLELL